MIRSKVPLEREPVKLTRPPRGSMLAALLVMLVLPPTAFAGSVNSTLTNGGAAVNFTGGAESNNITFERVASGDPDKPLRLTDSSAITDGDGAGGCDVTGTVARCPESVNGGGITAQLGAGGFGTPSSTEANTFISLTSELVLISGGDGPDTITTGGGDDSVSGHGGDDVLSSGGGSDSVSGGGGFFFGSSDGNDQLTGGAGNDNLNGGSGNDIVNADGGNDSVQAGAGDDSVDGGAEDDIINGADGDDTMSGAGGDDSMSGGGIGSLATNDGNDELSGGAGDDVIDGGSGDDIVNADEGSDEVLGGRGSDSLTGGDDPDTISGQLGDDTLNSNDGGPDQDDCGGGSDTVNGDASDVVAGDCETVMGASQLGPAGPTGSAGSDGAAGPVGASGPVGPVGPAEPRDPASKPRLFVEFRRSHLRVRHAAAFKVRYVVNRAALVTVQVRLGRKRVTGAIRRVSAGRNSVWLRAPEAGSYSLVVVSSRAGAADRDRIPLFVR
jgi:Ca2+-binding RTX toxin-like protein